MARDGMASLLWVVTIVVMVVVLFLGWYQLTQNVSGEASPWALVTFHVEPWFDADGAFIGDMTWWQHDPRDRFPTGRACVERLRWLQTHMASCISPSWPHYHRDSVLSVHTVRIYSYALSADEQRLLYRGY